MKFNWAEWFAGIPEVRQWHCQKEPKSFGSEPKGNLSVKERWFFSLHTWALYSDHDRDREDAETIPRLLLLLEFRLRRIHVCLTSLNIVQKKKKLTYVYKYVRMLSLLNGIPLPHDWKLKLFQSIQAHFWSFIPLWIIYPQVIFSISHPRASVTHRISCSLCLLCVSGEEEALQGSS